MSRFEVYNKDGDFFRDNKDGTMYELQVNQLGHKSHAEPASLVERIVPLLNVAEGDQGVAQVNLLFNQLDFPARLQILTRYCSGCGHIKQLCRCSL